MGLASLSLRICQPSTLRMVIWPDANSAQNSVAAVSAKGSTVWVLIRRLAPYQRPLCPGVTEAA